MKAMKNIALFVLALLLLTGCQAKPAADNADSEVDAVREWFTAEEPKYDLVSTDMVKEGVYALLTTFTPPGVEKGYTMVRAYPGQTPHSAQFKLNRTANDVSPILAAVFGI